MNKIITTNYKLNSTIKKTEEINKLNKQKLQSKKIQY